MWKLMIIAFVCLLILPSFINAKCGPQVISNVNVSYGVVQWAGTYDPSCVDSIVVCWNLGEYSYGYPNCETADANDISLTLGSDAYSCSLLQVQVYLVLRNGSSRSNYVYAKGSAGLPVVTKLIATTVSRDLIHISWYPPDGYCIFHIEFRMCDDHYQELNTCNLTKLDPSALSFDVRDHNFPVCHNFYVFVDTTNNIAKSAETSLQLYINSNNILTDATTMDVSTDSAVIKYNISIVDEICTKDVLEVKYYDIDDRPYYKIEDFLLSEYRTKDQVSLYGLTECAEYEALVYIKGSIIDSTNRKFVTFNTSKSGNPLLKEVKATKGTFLMVNVQWSIEAYMRTACVSQLQVSWTTTADEASMKKQLVSVGATNYSIQVEHNVHQTYNIQVDVLFKDNKWENHTTVFEWSPDTKLSLVEVNYGFVKWSGTYDPSSLKGFKVCWKNGDTLAESCQMTNATSLTLDNARSCSDITVTVTAVGAGTVGSSTASGQGRAGLPDISNLVATTAEHNLVQLNWDSLASFTCISHVHLWICDKEHEDISSCSFNQLDRNTYKFDLRDYNFPVCKKFYALMDTTDGSNNSTRTTLQLYIKSNNSLIGATATNIRSSSTELKCQFTIVDQGCEGDILEVRYYDTNHVNSEQTLDFPLTEIGATDLAQLNNLNECTKYTAELTLEGSRNDNVKKSVTFVTSKDNTHPLLSEVNATRIGNERVAVQWSTAANANTACVSHLQVSWNTTSHKEATSDSVQFEAKVGLYYINVRNNERQTYHVEVDVIFLDDSRESHMTVYEWNSSNHFAASPVLLIVGVMSLFSLYGIN